MSHIRLTGQHKLRRQPILILIFTAKNKDLFYRRYHLGEFSFISKGSNSLYSYAALCKTNPMRDREVG
jgi:hypothetical protein